MKSYLGKICRFIIQKCSPFIKWIKRYTFFGQWKYVLFLWLHTIDTWHNYFRTSEKSCSISLKDYWCCLDLLIRIDCFSKRFTFLYVQSDVRISIWYNFCSARWNRIRFIWQSEHIDIMSCFTIMTRATFIKINVADENFIAFI
jgi:hypothetical protein